MTLDEKAQKVKAMLIASGECPNATDVIRQHFDFIQEAHAVAQSDWWIVARILEKESERKAKRS